MGKRYKKILIVRLDRIGDVVLSTPVFRAVREAYPDSHIAVMVPPHAVDIVNGNPYIDETIVYDKHGAQKGAAGTLRFIDELKEKKFDLALILHPTRRTHLVAFLAGIPERVGYDRKWGCLLTRRIPHMKHLGLKHEIDYNLDLLRYVGITPAARALCVPLKGDAEERVRLLLRAGAIADTDAVIAINPGASCPSKRWPPDRFAKVGKALMAEVGAKIVIVAGEADRKLGEATASLIGKGCLDLSGKTSVADLASVLKRARLFISNDSGPVHIACAAGTPVVAIFGRNDRGLSPRRWGPSGKDDIILHKDVGCDVCLAHNCTIGFKCLDAITAENVLQAALSILGKARG